MEKEMEHEIEKDIPIPETRHRSKYYALAKEMEYGDSVVLETKAEANKLRSSIYKLGDKPVLRQTEENGTITFRVWKKAEGNKDE